MADVMAATFTEEEILEVMNENDTDNILSKEAWEVDSAVLFNWLDECGQLEDMLEESGKREEYLESQTEYLRYEAIRPDFGER